MQCKSLLYYIHNFTVTSCGDTWIYPCVLPKLGYSQVLTLD